MRRLNHLEENVADAGVDEDGLAWVNDVSGFACVQDILLHAGHEQRCESPAPGDRHVVVAYIGRGRSRLD